MLVSQVGEDPATGRRLAESLAAAPATSALERALTGRQRADLEMSLDYESWLAGTVAKERIR